MYIEIITSTKIPALEKGFTNTGEDCRLHVGINYAQHPHKGRYLISLLNRNNEEMESYFKMTGDEKFTIPLMNKMLNKTLEFFKDSDGKYQAYNDHVQYVVREHRTHTFFPFVSEGLIKRIKPYESLCDFMLRQTEELQQDVFLRLIMDFTFPHISDWVDTDYSDKSLIKMFREENHKFVEHMLAKCRANGTLHFIDDYIRARNDASIALNQISTK